MYENLSIQEYIKRMQAWDYQEAIKCQEVKEKCWEDTEPMGKFKTKKATKELIEVLDNGKQKTIKEN